MTEGKTFAETKWEQVQMDCAKAWANLDIAVEMVEENKNELTSEQYAEIKTKIDEQQAMIQNTLLEGKLAFIASGGVSVED